MKNSAANLHRIWSETDRKIDTLHKRVREGVEVLSAADFSRWLEWSGILELLEANPCNDIFKVDGKGLRRKAKALLHDCNEWFELHERSNVERALQIPRSQMEKLNVTLERMEKLLERIPPTVFEPEHVSQSVGVGQGGGGRGPRVARPVPVSALPAPPEAGARSAANP